MASEAADRAAALQRIIQEGLRAFRGLQSDIVNSTLDGYDVIGLMPTGGGKSLTFQIPALLDAGVTVVLCPLLALASDQGVVLRRKGVDVLVYTSARSGKIQLCEEKTLPKFVYTTAEQLHNVTMQALRALQGI